MTHLEQDDLITLAASLHWRPLEDLEHLASCERCREELRSLSKLHESLNHVTDPRAGFTNRVMAALAANETVADTRASRTVPAILAPTLAGLTAFAALASTTGGRASSGWVLPTIVMAAMTGIAVALWNTRAAHRVADEPA